MKSDDLKSFLLRGNIVDLAVAFVVAVAFGAVVASLVNDVIMQIVAAIIGQPDFSSLSFDLNGTPIYYGKFLNTIINFVIIGTVVFYFVVVPINAMMAKYKKEPPPDPSIKKCPECLSDIPAEARKCSFCTSPQDVGEMPAEA